MLSGFSDFFSGMFTSNKRNDFIEQANKTKDRIAQSNLSAAKKKVFLAVIDYAMTTNSNILVNLVTSDGDIDAKGKLLNKILALSKTSDDHLLNEVNSILTTLPKNDETLKTLIDAVNAATTELQSRRDTAYKIAGAIAALGSLTFAYFNPLLGTLTIATEIAVVYTQDLSRLKPYLNEATEMVECGTIIEAIVDGPEKAREALARNTFKP